MLPSRREFMKWSAAGGIVLSLSRFAGAQTPDFLERETLPGRGVPHPAIGRVDGVAKVTGAKLYASDFRAVDLPGWPAETHHALLLRTPDASHVYEGLALDGLGADAKPATIIAAEDIAKIGLRVPPFYTGDLFCPIGTTPLYLGQPVALLLFDRFDAYDRARTFLRDNPHLKFGAETGPLTRPNYGAFRFTRVAGATPDAPDLYSPIQEGWISPGFVESSGRPVWQVLPDAKGADYVKGATYGTAIRDELAKPAAGTLVLDRSFATQSIDPMFLEPEAGLGFYEPGARKLDLVLGVQSPFEAAEAIAYMLGEAVPDFKPASIDGKFCYVGGGFGGRDHTPFPLYLTLAAMFFPGRPVRLAHDRFQQFQGGIKRHAFKMRSQIAVDRASGTIAAFAADHVLDGGGLMNYSVSVAVVAGTGAIGMYNVPKVDVTTVAEHTRGVTAGSMRGYGTVQCLTALETLVDEVCTTLPLDPIEFRRRNALKVGERTLTGNPYSVSVRAPEILDKLDGHPIWRNRAAEKAKAPAGVLVGTGVACAAKDYGTGADCSLGTVEIDAEGRISIHSDAVEMGNGIGTALANRVAGHIGGIADQVTVAQVDVFDALGLVKSGDPYSITQAEQDAAAANPRWVPEISSATSASIGAHVGTQAASEAARVVFRFGLWPAALAIWGIPAADPRVNQSDQAFWQGETLIFSGLPPLSLKALAAKAHQQGGVTGAMTHAFSRWAWSEATFALPGGDWSADIDALAVRRGSGAFQVLDRKAVAFPPTDYNRIGTSFASMCGTTLRVEIERATGKLTIAKAYSVVECGQALVPEIVLGQSQGGFAMGVGQALLEDLPPFEEGPGNGQWNLGRYVVARASDLPLHDLEIEILPPLSPREPPKGMAEVVMIPVIPALLNAIFDATGHRFQSLPVTPQMIKGVIG
ncbi:molybdopterin cofactor-binding domain-containing protein [Ancylobacter sp. 3268]|uniref:xanthine dehydrogenase family protein molybdopterin-binding subunit n=1 Tax=Ancylobacter sp. 3268 TaxID=2817752 RepID=UPI00286B56AC|nr:molybdopterin cofactor-binding domain-containing protein [Ancylobacter sp. 3268]